jgi:tetratricopeptide (TPR) repeat protein
MAVSVFVRIYLILSLYGVGRFEEAAACEAETTQLASRTEHVFTIAFTHLAAVSLHVGKGDWAKAHSRIEQWLALIQTTDVKHWNSFALGFSALVLAWLGRADEAMTRLLEAEQVIEQQIMRGNLIHAPSVSQLLGRACVVLGPIENAQRLAKQAMEGSARRPETTPQTLLLLADIARHPDCFDPEQSERLYRRAQAAAEAQGRRPILAHCNLGLGRLYSSIGKRQEAGEHFAAARTMYREMDMAFWLTQVEQEMLV